MVFVDGIFVGTRTVASFNLITVIDTLSQTNTIESIELILYYLLSMFMVVAIVLDIVELYGHILRVNNSEYFTMPLHTKNTGSKVELNKVSSKSNTMNKGSEKSGSTDDEQSNNALNQSELGDLIENPKSTKSNNLVNSKKVKVVDYPTTIESVLENPTLNLFILGEFKDKSQVLDSSLLKINCLVFLLRLGAYQAIISSMNMLTRGPVIFLILVEGAYFGYNTYCYFKFKHLKNSFIIIGKVLQSVFLLTFLFLSFTLSAENPKIVMQVPAGK